MLKRILRCFELVSGPKRHRKALANQGEGFREGSQALDGNVMAKAMENMAEMMQPQTKVITEIMARMPGA